jgi:hypothetical protein
MKLEVKSPTTIEDKANRYDSVLKSIGDALDALDRQLDQNAHWILGNLDKYISETFAQQLVLIVMMEPLEEKAKMLVQRMKELKARAEMDKEK